MMECYKEISFVAAMGLQVLQRTEDVFFREKGSLDMFSLHDADLRDITLSTALESTWFFKTKNPHQSRQRLVGEQQNET